MYRTQKPKGWQGDPAEWVPESELWHKDVFVRFQENAWADPAYSRDWLLNCYAADVDTSVENVLFADNLVGQTRYHGSFFADAVTYANTKVRVPTAYC